MSVWRPQQHDHLCCPHVRFNRAHCCPHLCSLLLYYVRSLDQRKHDAELLDDTLHLGMRITSMEGGWTQVLDNLSRLPEQSRRLAVRQFGAAALLHDQTYPSQPNPFTDFEYVHLLLTSLLLPLLSRSVN